MAKSQRKPKVGKRRGKPTSRSVYKFARFTNPFTLTKGLSDQGYGATFSLSDLAASSEFTALFDEWRITAVTAVWILSGQQLPGVPCIMYVYPDFDDAVAPTALVTALQVQGMKPVTLSASSPTFRMRLVPKSFAASSAGSVESPSGWHDVAYPSDSYFGLKWWMTNYNSSVYSGTFITVMYEFEIEFRSVR